MRRNLALRLAHDCLQLGHGELFLLEQQQPQVDINLAMAAAPVADGIFEVTVTATVTTKLKDRTLFLIEAKQAANGKYGQAMQQAKDVARKAGIELHCHVFTGHEVKTIVEFIAAHGFDLLVVGFMGHSALYDRVMGSTCQSLVRLAPCTVLVVKRGPAARRAL